MKINRFTSQIYLRGWCLAWIFLVMLISLCLSAQVALAEDENLENLIDTPLHMGPPSGEGPTRVSVCISIIDILTVDEPSESFDLDAYLTLSWSDKRLIPSEDMRFMDDFAQDTLDKIWWPDIQFNNQIGEKEVLTSMLEITSDGCVTYDERFQVTLYSELKLAKFPFDSQKLHIEIESFCWDNSQVELTLNENTDNKPILFYYEPDVSEWNIDSEIASEVKITGSPATGRQYTTITADIGAARKTGFHIWKIFLPLSLIIVISWTVFWIGTESVSSRLSVAVIAFLTAVSYGFFINSSLPQISYLTFMDGFITGIYLFMTLTVIVLLGAHLLQLSGRDVIAVQINSISRWVFPIAFTIYLIGIVLIFLI